MQEFPEVPAPGNRALNSESASWVPTCPRPETSGFWSCFSFPTYEMERPGRRRCLRSLPYLSPSSYYTKKRRALRLNPDWKGRWRGHSGSRAHAGLTFFCQAARLSGLSSDELELSLNRLNKAGAPRAGRGPAGGGGPHSEPAVRTSLSFSSYWLPLSRCAQPLRSDP